MKKQNKGLFLIAKEKVRHNFKSEIFSKNILKNLDKTFRPASKTAP